MRQRLVRLLKAFFPHLARPDDAWALGWLKEDERGLYLAMDVRDREHAVQVARRLLERYPHAPDYAVRAALLHDAGKALRPYRPLERILTGLITLPVPPHPLHRGLLGAFQVRRYHAQYAASRIQDRLVAEIVRLHHVGGSPWAERLRAVDGEF